MGKPIKRSKTFWLNAVLLTVAILAPTGALVKIFRPEIALYVDAVVTYLAIVGNLVLRIYFTKEPIQR